MDKPKRQLALARQIGPDTSLPETMDENRRQWVHLFPWGDVILGDGRGPFRLTDENAALVMAQWEQQNREQLVDYEHLSDEDLPSESRDSKAAGWIQEQAIISGDGILMSSEKTFSDSEVLFPGDETRPGLWGLIQWTPAMAEMIASREYKYISPILYYAGDTGDLIRIAGAGVTNVPAIEQLKAVAAKQRDREEDMADKVEAWKTTASALGIQAANEDEFNKALAALKERAKAADDLEQQLATEKAEREKVEAEAKANAAKQAATDKVVAAIGEGRIPEGAKESYIEMHIAGPEVTEKALAAMETGKYGDEKSDGPGGGRLTKPATGEKEESKGAADGPISDITADGFVTDHGTLEAVNKAMASVKRPEGEAAGKTSASYRRAVRLAAHKRLAGGA